MLRYEDAPRPMPAAGEVLVRIHAVGVNPIDWKVRAGHVRDWLRYTLPMIPGWDFSGVLEEVGPTTSHWKTGDEVYARPDIGRDGAYAEYVAVRASEIASKPNLSIMSIRPPSHSPPLQHGKRSLTPVDLRRGKRC